MPQGPRPPRQSSAQRKIAEMRGRRAARQRRVRAMIGGAAAAVIIAVAAVLIALNTGHSTPTAAPARAMATGATVDGIHCDQAEQVAYHIHAHLAIFVDGHARTVPAGIGIPGPQQVQSGFVDGGKCFYWLHTHDTTGVIHIESPTQRVYTLGQFFDIWGQPLGRDQVGTSTGHVTVFVNGRAHSGDPRSIKLTPHEVIQLDVGAAVPPRPFTFPSGL